MFNKLLLIVLHKTNLDLYYFIIFIVSINFFSLSILFNV